MTSRRVIQKTLPRLSRWKRVQSHSIHPEAAGAYAGMGWEARPEEAANCAGVEHALYSVDPPQGSGRRRGGDARGALRPRTTPRLPGGHALEPWRVGPPRASATGG